MLDRMSDALALLAAPLIDAAERLGAPGADAALERPADPEHGDYATTLALRLAKPLRRPPREIAEELAAAAQGERVGRERRRRRARASSTCASRPRWYAEAVRRAREPGFGGGTAAPPQRVNVEYVSANPTGPLPVSAGRNAAYGDSLARLFAFAGHEVTREYYFNDSGAQIERFGLSLRARARGEERARGRLSGRVLIAASRRRRGLSPDAPAEEFGARRRGADVRGASARRSSASACRWTSTRTRSTCTARAASSARSSAPARPVTCSSRTARPGCASSEFGDDKDRPVIKSDGSPTYLAGDLAYLVDKLERGFDLAIYVLGADHHGYAARLKAAAQALGYDAARIEIALYQMVHLIEDGEQKRMSKRRGDVVLLDELMDGIGVDAARFYLVQRSHDATIDIDLAQAVEQGPENPVYYVQYAHARICSILRRAGRSRRRDARRCDRAGAERGGARARARRLPRRLPRGRRAARAAPRRRLRARSRRRRSRRSTAIAR